MHLAVLSDPNHFHTQKWVQGLLRAGVKVSVLSFFDGQIPGAECFQIKARFAPGGKINYFSYISSGGALGKMLKKLNVDVLNPINVTPYGVWGEKSGFRPLVQVAMGADILEYPPKLSDLDISLDRLYNSNSLGMPSSLEKLIFPWKWRIFRRNVRKALEAASFSIGDNQQLVDAMREWFGIEAHKLQLNRWGIESKFFEKNDSERAKMKATLKIKEGARLVLAPRGLKPVYQGDIILEAFERVLKNDHQDLHFLVLSAGYEAPKEVEAKAKQMAEQFPNFSFVENLIPREQMGILWSLVDAFVIAPVYDGYSNALNEGRFVGAIPILNDIPAHREVMEDHVNCLMVKPFEAGKLAQVLEDLPEKHEEWKAKFAPKNQEWVQREAMFNTNIYRFLRGIEKHL